MHILRRDILRAITAAGLTLPFAGCEKLIRRASLQLGESVPAHLTVASSTEIEPAFHLLSRAAYGPWPGDVDRVRKAGTVSWLEEQLAPQKIDDRACDLRARRFEALEVQAGEDYEFKKPVLRDQLVRRSLLRAIYSKRQMFEVMVGFWTDHLNIYLDKGDSIYLKPADDRDVVRANALGNFARLIRASATSPAMLVYLDGKDNVKSGPNSVPNENYARELLELHTLGVDGGYTQKDVSEVARCLTGWRLRTKWRRGSVFFDPALHDDGQKVVLGHVIPAGGGAKDLDDVVRIACSHPATARHIATKLVRHFVADDPPPSLVSKVATRFTDTRGEIKPLLRTILISDEFQAARGAKLKRPFRLIASTLRMLGADTFAHGELIDYLRRMGMLPYGHPMPDGYPDFADPWLGSMLERWNFAFALASNRIDSTQIPLNQISRAIGGAEPDRLFAYLVGRKPAGFELQPLVNFVSKQSGSHGSSGAPDLLALALASPAFQRH